MNFTATTTAAASGAVAATAAAATVMRCGGHWPHMLSPLLNGISLPGVWTRPPPPGHLQI